MPTDLTGLGNLTRRLLEDRPREPQEKQHLSYQLYACTTLSEDMGTRQVTA